MSGSSFAWCVPKAGWAQGGPFAEANAEPQGLASFFFGSHHLLVADRPAPVLLELPHELVWCEPHIPGGKSPQHQAGVILLPGANQAKARSDFAQTTALFCHRLALGSGEFGSGSFPRGSRLAVCWEKLLKAGSQNLTAKLLLFLPDLWFVSDSMSHQSPFSPAQNSTGKSANSFDNSNFQSLSHNTIRGPDPEIIEVFPCIESEPKMAEPEREK